MQEGAAGLLGSFCSRARTAATPIPAGRVPFSKAAWSGDRGGSLPGRGRTSWQAGERPGLGAARLCVIPKLPGPALPLLILLRYCRRRRASPRAALRPSTTPGVPGRPPAARLVRQGQVRHLYPLGRVLRAQRSGANGSGERLPQSPLILLCDPTGLQPGPRPPAFAGLFSLVSFTFCSLSRALHFRVLRL